MTKNFLFQKAIMILVYCFLCASCEQDDSIIADFSKEALSYHPYPHLNNRGDLPYNTDNPYDSVGIIHTHILDAYLSFSHAFTTIEDVQINIHSIMQEFELTDPLRFSEQEYLEIINTPETVWNNLLTTSVFSEVAKDNLKAFREIMMGWENKTWSLVYTDLLFYENDVLQNSSLSPDEKRMILTLTSIVRHSVHYKKGRDDKDWDISVGNFSGALKGAMANKDSAVALALIAGLYNEGAILN